MVVIDFVTGRNAAEWETAPIVVVRPKGDTRESRHKDYTIGTVDGKPVLVDYENRTAILFESWKDVPDYLNRKGWLVIRIEPGISDS